MTMLRKIFAVAGWSCMTLAAPAAARAQASRAPQFRGTINCEQCHTSPIPTVQSTGALDRVRLTEAATWRNSDRHSKAYENLRGPLGQRIGKLLGVDVLTPEAGCVQCHATSIDADRWSSNNVDFAREGVGCEACHGPSSNWVAEHQQYPAWKNLPAANKAELGWVDVTSPSVRAEVCYSCHVGSQRDQRVISHEMFAAGHPPLTGFEIESFANRMPKHWQYPYEKPPHQPSFERTQDLLVASIVGLRMSVELAMADVEQKRWPELARYDCFACHHDLADSRWRQLRTETGIPGRPELSVGSLPTVVVAAEVVDGKASAEQLVGLMEQLHAPFQSASFGDPQTIVDVGPEIVRWCSFMEQQLVKESFKPEQARAVLHGISQQASSEYVDFDTARQLLGAWCVVYEELVANHALPLDPTAQEQVDALLKQIQASDFFVLTRLSAESPQGASENQAVAARLPELFADRAKFKPDKFAAVMKRLDELTR